MEIKLKIYQKNGETFFERTRKKRAFSAISDALWYLSRYDYEKIDIYADTKLTATIYG